TGAQRVAHVVQAAFAGKRIVVFSGGATKGEDSVFEDAIAIRDGGGNGSIIGRNTFQRPRDKAIAMLDHIIDIYEGKAGGDGAATPERVGAAVGSWPGHGTGSTLASVSRGRPPLAGRKTG